MIEPSSIDAVHVHKRLRFRILAQHLEPSCVTLDLWMEIAKPIRMVPSERININIGNEDEIDVEAMHYNAVVDSLVNRALLENQISQPSVLYPGGSLAYLPQGALMPGLVSLPLEQELSLLHQHHLNSQLLGGYVLPGLHQGQIATSRLLPAYASLGVSSDLERLSIEREIALSQRMMPSAIRSQLNQGISSLAASREARLASLPPATSSGALSSTRIERDRAVNSELASMDTLKNRSPKIAPSQGASRLRKDGSHLPVVVYLDSDEESLSEYQCLLRKQVELFEA